MRVTCETTVCATDAIRREARMRAIVLNGAGEKFFCIGGRKEGMANAPLYAGALPTSSPSPRLWAEGRRTEG
jgi:naphthoate synthase